MRPSLIFFFVLSLIAGVQGAAFAQQTKPVIRFPEEDQALEATASPGPAAGSWSEPSPPNYSPPSFGVVGAGRGDIADQLNHAELNRLLRRGPRGGPFR